jgi:CTP:molybdopterin cytidylyltransferase MocA
MIVPPAASAPRFVGVVLAAGSGTRMGRPKADVVLDGHRLVDRASASMAGCDEVIAVVRPGVAVAGVRTIVNPAPERGMRSSLELAVAAAREQDVLVVTLVDLPGITRETVDAVRRAWRPGRVTVGRFGSRRGHPTVMSLELWRAAVSMAGPDEGARLFLAGHPELVDEVDVPGDPADLDRPDDLAAWRSRPAPRPEIDENRGH